MPNRLPTLAVILGLGGLLPLIGCAMGVVTLRPLWVHVALFGLIGYGACILSFIGAVHWGIELSGGGERPPVGGVAELAPVGGSAELAPVDGVAELAPVGGSAEPPLVSSRPAAAGLLSVHYARLTLGVIPALIGWGALLALSLGLAFIAIGVLIFGFIATLIVERQANQRGLLPHGYIWLRYVLSAVVIVVLVAAEIGVLFVPRIVL